MITIMIRKQFWVLGIVGMLLPGLFACSGDSNATRSAKALPGGRPRIVVTYGMVGSVVRDVVGSKADVVVLMPNGADPHEWSPSAKDVQSMLRADLVIENGLGLEGKLQTPLERVRAAKINVFTASDHVAVRRVKAGEGAEPDDPDQAPGAQDPHIWMDPLTMTQWIGPLVAVLKDVGVEVDAATVEADLARLNDEVASILGSVPAGQRKLVTGHESLGYLAERYGYALIGAVIPSVSSQAEASAGELAELKKKIKEAGVSVIFTEIGTPGATVKAIGADSGAKVVELSTHTLPKDGTYRTFMKDIATKIATALR